MHAVPAGADKKGVDLAQSIEMPERDDLRIPSEERIEMEEAARLELKASAMDTYMIIIIPIQVLTLPRIKQMAQLCSRSHDEKKK